ncbi:MAG: hypothetical protein QOF53_2434, partial [Nocardioidaceae bacterium]|nr:hypothetical protein [Nocardioidaceae bacterium]
GNRISVRATASRIGYRRVAAVSASTRPVTAGRFAATARPLVRGTARVGETVSATAGSWVPAPSSLTYQWSAAGKPVKNASRPTLRVGPALAGKALRVTVTATRAGYRPLGTSSVKTEPVALGRITTQGAPALVGSARPGGALRLHDASFTPRDAVVSVTWWRSGVRVKGLKGTSYRVSGTDLGARIAARMTLTAPGYRTRTLRTPYTARVRSVARVRLTVGGRHGHVRATVSLSAPGVRHVTGKVRIGWRGRTLRQVVLHGGSATSTLNGVPAGVRRLAVTYTGSRLVAPRTVTRTVRVR